MGTPRLSAVAALWGRLVGLPALACRRVNHGASRGASLAHRRLRVRPRFGKDGMLCERQRSRLDDASAATKAAEKQ